ncbi:hypothetical protein MNV49_004959 [Pseudohyphozyma bogoriensis]|nr:hypothetical protein MNV49_004959 [Pseudohyphozyma bogoriensis]
MMRSRLRLRLQPLLAPPSSLRFRPSSSSAPQKPSPSPPSVPYTPASEDPATSSHQPLDEVVPLAEPKHIPTPPPVEESAPLVEPEKPKVVVDVGEETVGRVRRPVGAFRGGLIGFLLATTLVGGYGYFALLSDYSAASKVLLASVEELKDSTAILTTHIKRIEHVETALSTLEGKAVDKDEIAGLRKEYRALLETDRLDLLALKAHLWGLEQDLSTLSKKGSNQTQMVT